MTWYNIYELQYSEYKGTINQQGEYNMSNKDKVYSELKTMTINLDTNSCGYTSNEIAAVIGLKRNVVSHLLNQLYEEGKAIKINTRPVYFVDKEIYEKSNKKCLAIEKYINKMGEQSYESNSKDPFKRLIGYNGSLKFQVEQCKSSAAYPPNGLSILLLGNTGVGKSYMAQLIYEYAQSMSYIDRDAPFIILNCAEYADNPELLTAHIFGTCKGAFTGADRDKTGLLEKADGGYLFLDEIHRLSPEGQEKLFLFIDRGIFRRLGENGKWRSSKVRFIFATTEDPQVTFLQTFLRRIPIIVNIPPLYQRPVNERLQLINYVYYEEARNIQKDILISGQVLNLLLKVKMTGNIGKLINIIKYSCANAYNMQVGKKKKVLNIHLSDIPGEIALENQNIDNNIYLEDMLITEEKQPENIDENIQYKKEIESISQKIIKLLMEYDQGNISIDRVKAYLLINLNNFSDVVIFKWGQCNNNSLLYDTLIKTIEYILQYIENEYGIKYYGNTAKILATFISYFLENIYEIKDNQNNNYDKCISTLKLIYPKEYIISSRINDMLGKKIDFKLDKMGIIYLTLYINSINKDLSENTICSIIIAHGYSTASSIASVANRLLGQFIFEAFDMPVDLNVQEMMRKVKEHLENINTKDGLILLVDMGSLKTMYKSLEDVLDCDIGIINNITTQLALDVGSRIMEKQSIEQIVNEAVKNNNSECTFIKLNRNKKDAIVTTCITGIGTAKKIRNLLLECFNNNKIEIIAYDFFKLRDNNLQDEFFKNYNVKLIIGTSDPHVSSVKYISLEDLITGKGEADLGSLFREDVDVKTIDNVNRAVVRIFSLQNVLNHLIILNPDKILDQVEQVIEQLEINLGMQFKNELKISLYIHISSLIERLVMKDPILSYEDLDKFLQCHGQFIKIVESAFSVIEDYYKIKVPVSEIGYIYEIIHIKIDNLPF